MDRFPAVVRRLVAAEQSCHLVHYYASFCDFTTSPEAIPAAAFSAAPADDAADEPTYKLVYDVMRTRDRRILFKQSYAERYVHSLALAAPAHTFPTELQLRLQECLQRYVDTTGVYLDGVKEQNLKIVSWLPESGAAAATAAADASTIPVIFFLPKSSYPAEAMYHDGAKLGFLYNAHRVNPNAKVAQTALRDRANAYQRENDLFEVLLVHDAAGHFLVPEGSRSNYLLQRDDGSWWCSAEEDILVGITLKTTYRVMEACGQGRIHHGKLTLKDVMECKALYMLGTSPTILPIQSVLLYKDDETRRCFEAAVQALAVDLTAPSVSSRMESSGGDDNATFAVLRIAVDTELAPRLRSQYFAEAAAS